MVIDIIKFKKNKNFLKIIIVNTGYMKIRYMKYN